MNSQMIRAMAPAMAAIVAIGAIVGALLLLHFPLYTDEVQWKALGSRLFLDNFSLNYLFPACTAGFIQPVPISWWPSRLIDATIYSNAGNPLMIRYIGIATYFAIWAGIGWIIHRLWRDIPLWICISVALGLTSFGMLTPLLVMNRPEQGILVPFLVIVGIYLVSRERTELPGQARSWLYCLVLGLLVWLMLGAHLKSFVLLPIAILAAAAAIRRRWPMIVFVFASGFAFYENYRLWATRTDCPASPYLEAQFAYLSLSPKLLLADPARFLSQSLADLERSLAYFGNAWVRSNGYPSHWWPTGPASAFDNISNLAFSALALVLICLCLWGAVRYAVRYAVRGWGQAPRPNAAITFWLTLGLLAFMIYQITKNFYETSLVWPLLVLAAIFALKDRGPWLAKATIFALPVLTIFMLIAQFALVTRVWPHLDEWNAAASSQDARQQQIIDLAANCHTTVAPEQAGLVVDDFAYSVFWPTKRPMFNSYFYGPWSTGLDHAATVTALDLKAEIAKCTEIPEQYRSEAQRSADQSYCCVHFSS